MRSLSTEVKVAVAIAAIALSVSLAGARVVKGALDASVAAAGHASLRAAADALATEERTEVEKLSATLDGLLGNDDLREAFVARDRARLLALTAPILKTLKERDGISHWYFHAPEPDPVVFLRVHLPELFGDRVERVTLRRAIETRELGAGLELGATAFALRAVRPWVHEGRVLGYVELAEDIDHFLSAVKARTGDDYGLLLMKKYLDEREWAAVLGPRANTWNDRPDVVVVDATTFTEGIVDYAGDVAAVPEGGEALGQVERADRVFARAIFPVRDAAGRRVGGVFILRDLTSARTATRAAASGMALLLVAIGLAGALATIWTVRLLVFRRLGALRRDLEARAAVDGLPPSRVVQLRSEDEIGRLEALLDRVLFPSRGRGTDAPPPATGD
jgi:hypothetical protein